MLGETRKLWKEIWIWLRQKLGLVLFFVSPVLFLYGLIVTNFDSILGAMDEMNSTLASVETTAAANSALPAAATVWNIARYFAPVELCLYYMGALLYLKVVCTMVRILKSFIPTIS